MMEGMPVAPSNDPSVLIATIFERVGNLMREVRDVKSALDDLSEKLLVRMESDAELRQRVDVLERHVKALQEALRDKVGKSGFRSFWQAMLIFFATLGAISMVLSLITSLHTLHIIP